MSLPPNRWPWRRGVQLADLLSRQIGMAILLPFAIVLVILGTSLSTYLEHAESQQHETLARIVTGQVNSFLEAAAAEVRLVARILGEQDKDQAGVTRVLDSVVAETGTLSALLLVGADGRIEHLGLPRSRRAVRDNYIGVDMSGAAHVRAAGASRSGHWSDVSLSAISGDLVIGLAIALPRHTLVAEIPLDQLADRLSVINRNQLLTMILDDKGHIIAHADRDKAAQRISLRHVPLVQSMLNGMSESTGRFRLEGIDYLGTTVAIPKLRWHALVATPRERILKPLWLAGWMALGGVLMGMLVAMLLARLSARRAATEVAGFGEAARRIAEGQYQPELPQSDIRELRALGQHLRAMAEAIEQREQDLRHNERQFRTFYDAGLVGLALIDVDGHWLRLNDVLARILGIDPEALLGRDWVEVLHDEDALPELGQFRAVASGGADGHEAEVRMVAADGRSHWVLIVLRCVRRENGQPDYVALLAQDISARREAEGRIERLAFFDSLTDLPNRRLFQDRLQHAMGVSRANHRQGAVLFMDLDNFKLLNDSAGHAVGDELLVAVAKRLRRIAREADTVSRFGGDEFVIMMEDLTHDPTAAATEVEVVAETILTMFEQPFVLGGREHYCSVSLGICLFDGEGLDAHEVLRRADAAMYQAKSAGRGTLRFYDPDLQTALEQRTQLSNELRRAVPNGELRLVLQGIHDRAGMLRGAEALVRWQHPRSGEVGPEQFIPLAEDTALIHEIGAWVLEQACMVLGGWRENPAMAEVSLSVNVSPQQFRHPKFVEQVSEVLSRHRVVPGQLRMELTETLLLDNLEEVNERMLALKGLGVGLSLDDFGTGYSSLDYLKRLPFDQLKIDRSFVRDIGHDPIDSKIVEASLAVGRLLEIPVVAEGVETSDQFDFLAGHGCSLFQGFHFGRPTPVTGFAASQRMTNT